MLTPVPAHAALAFFCGHEKLTVLVKSSTTIVTLALRPTPLYF